MKRDRFPEGSETGRLPALVSVGIDDGVPTGVAQEGQ
jgi:hypothetical protein